MDQNSLSYPCYSRPQGDSPTHASLLEAYERHLLDERGLRSSRAHIRVAVSFLVLLEASDCGLDEISVAHIQRFITEQGRYYERRTIASIASYLRVFLRHLAFAKVIPEDLSGSVRRPCTFRGEREAGYLQDWQVRQVLNSIDQSELEGKRNYALLLLLAVYGLRATEVVGLRLEDCRWSAGKLLICDRKCSDALELPLPPEVAQSIVAYLRVRPKVGHREIFLRVIRPYRPLGSVALCTIARKAILRCGFDVAHPGCRTFRYSRAQALFAAQRPLPEIAATLGHRDLRTTLGYLSFTVHPLRELALNAGEDLA